MSDVAAPPGVTGGGGSQMGPEAAQRMLDALGQAVIATDLDLIITYVNPAAAALYGWTAQEAVGRNVGDLLAPSDQPSAPAMATEAARTGSWSGEVSAQRRDGTVIPLLLRITPTCVGHGDVSGFVGVGVDLTDRQRMENAIRESEAHLRAVVMNTPVVLFAFDEAGVGTMFAGAGLERAGMKAENLVGMPLLARTSRLPELTAAIASTIAGEASRATAVVGGRTWEVRCQPNRSPNGTVIGGIGVAADITEQIQAAAQLRENEVRFRSLVEHGTDLLAVVDEAARFTFASPAVGKLLGVPAEELVGRSSLDFMHPDDLQRSVDSLRGTVTTPSMKKQVQYRLVTASGEVRWVEGTGQNLLDVPGINGIVTNMRDITERRAAEQALAASQARYQQIVETAHEGVWILDVDGNTVFANPKSAELLGVDSETLTGASVYQFLDAENAAIVADALERRERTEAEPYEVRFQRADGTPRWVLISPSPLFDEDGKFVGSLGMLTDITERKRVEAELAHLALRDSLTGLANRTLLLDRLGHALSRAARTSERVAVLFVDLDQFKLINDSLGHGAGDRVLRIAASRIEAAVRPDDTVARFGGDEFIVLCENVRDETEAAEIAARVRARIAPVMPLERDREVFLTASVGVALSPAVSPEVLIGNADAAMYRAKARGRDRVELYGDALRVAVTTQLRLRTELRQAIGGQQFGLFYQPVVNVADGSVVGMEALLRWRHPRAGWLEPKQFIAVAEDSGMIVEIGRWVLTEACRQASLWQVDNPTLQMSVNLSARQLGHPGIDQDIADAVREWELDPATVTVEVTETAVMDDPEAALEVLRRLRAHGVHLAIDDFGTGYSSLVYLKRFPVGKLKIDRSFVDGLGTDPEDTAIVASVVSLAHAFGAMAIAEGVETAEQLAELRRLGCDQAQGYLWSRPVPGRTIDTSTWCPRQPEPQATPTGPLA